MNSLRDRRTSATPFEGVDVLSPRPYALEIGLKSVDNRWVGYEDEIVVLAGEPRPREVARTCTQQLPIDRIRFQMHEHTLALDPRYDVRVGKQCFDEPASNGSVLGELRLVEIETDDHVPFRGVGQRLDDLRVGEDVSRHVDGESSAANLLSVHRLEIFSRSIMDLDLGAALGPVGRINPAMQTVRQKRVAIGSLRV